MQNEENIIYCSRCGSEMNANSRYCMKCGNLNESHPDNNKYSKIFKKTNKENNYQIGSGKKLFNKSDNKAGMNYITDKNTESVRLGFIIFNIIIIGILCVIALLPLVSLIGDFSVNKLLECGVFNNLLYVGIFSIFFVSSQILFIKLDQYWWAALIPFYNYYILSKAIFNKGWLFILLFIPGVNIIYSLVLLYVLGESFGKSGILTVLLGTIMIPIIAFGSSAFNGVYYVVDSSRDSLEKTYGSYRRFAEFSIFVLGIGLLGIVYNNFGSQGGTDELFVIGGANIAVNNVKKAIKKDKVHCVDVNNNPISIYTNGEYYFYSDDFLTDYSFKSNLVYESNGYVKVVSNNGTFDYFVAYVSDGLGIQETNKDDLNGNIVKEGVVIEEPVGNMCTID